MLKNFDENKISDEELMKMFCKTLDENIFKVLMERYYAIALSIVRKRIWNYLNAEDIVQDAFIKVVQKRDKFDLNLKFSNWFYKIVNNISIDYLRKELRNNDKIKEITILYNNSNDINQDYLIEHLSVVKDDDKKILTLHYIDGFSFKEISEKTGISTEAIKKRAQRAIKKIKKGVM